MINLRKLKRGPQVILPRDAAAIIAHAGVSNGDRVVEAGSGSGFMTIFIANSVGDSGKVYSYENREEFLEIARKNVEKVGFASRVEFKLRDVTEGVDEKDVDCLLLDCGGSDKLVGVAFNALKKDGILAGYLPNVEQLKAFVLAAEDAGFVLSEALEVFERDWLVRRDRGCRPSTHGLSHSAFLAFLRK
ncbi:MAG: methyltransferase domain-containing protein [Candidatus Micrarchaeota archaeon]